MDLAADARCPELPGPGDLDGRPVRRDRALTPSLLRNGPAALPRHPCALHDQRPRGARGVLRQLPDATRGRQGVGSRLWLLVLRGDDRARAAWSRDPRRGKPARGGKPTRPRGTDPWRPWSRGKTAARAE